MQRADCESRRSPTIQPRLPRPTGCWPDAAEADAAQPPCCWPRGPSLIHHTRKDASMTPLLLPLCAAFWLLLLCSLLAAPARAGLALEIADRTSRPAALPMSRWPANGDVGATRQSTPADRVPDESAARPGDRSTTMPSRRRRQRPTAEPACPRPKSDDADGRAGSNACRGRARRIRRADRSGRRWRETRRRRPAPNTRWPTSSSRAKSFAGRSSIGRSSTRRFKGRIKRPKPARLRSRPGKSPTSRPRATSRWSIRSRASTCGRRCRAGRRCATTAAPTTKFRPATKRLPRRSACR